MKRKKTEQEPQPVSFIWCDEENKRISYKVCDKKKCKKRDDLPLCEEYQKVIHESN